MQKKPRLTQEQLAARVQVLGMTVDRAGISKIEIGLRTVTDIEILILAEALNVSAAWLLNEANSAKE